MNAVAKFDAAAAALIGERLKDPWWRLTSGALYQVKDRDGFIRPFIPTALQADFLRTMHDLEVILKARQIGWTTLIEIYQFDHAAWNPDQQCVVIAQDLDTAQAIFRDKVRFVYDHLPAPLRAEMPLKVQNTTTLHFAHNNSLIYCDTSTRGGTPNRVHWSEAGKTSVQSPIKAKEVVTGVFPSVPASGRIIIESTAEGQAGEFFDIANGAEERSKNPAPLREVEWNFRFYAWWELEEYAIDPEGIAISSKDHKYFDEIEAKVILAGKRPPGFKITLPQRAWYVATRRSKAGNDSAKMWQEFPSIPAEAWMRSPEGVFYAEQLTDAVAGGRMLPLPFVSYTPVNTFWDIGSSDGTAIWLHQHVHPEHRFLRFVEGWFKPYIYFVQELEKIAVSVGTGMVWGTHYLPHDADHKRQGQDRVWSPLDMLTELRPSWRFEIVPPVAELQHGIAATRRAFPQMWFNVDESEPVEDGEDQAPDCRRGVTHLWNYRKRRNTQTGGWMDEEVKNEAREAADALRQFGQVFDRLGATLRPGQFPQRKGARKALA